MASRAYRQAASFAKKAAKPPAKTVVFSLMAFLLVAAAPWLIIQSDAVVEDSGYLEYDEDLNLYLTGVKNTAGDLTPDACTFEEFDDHYYFLSPSTDLSRFVLSFCDSEGEPVDFSSIVNEDGVSRIVLNNHNGQFTLFIIEYSVSPGVYESYKSVVEGDTLVLELSYLDLLNIALYGGRFIIYPTIEAVQSGDPIEVDFLFETLYDDYTGSIIAFAAGIGLVVLAVLSTNLVNPTRWGKR